MEEKRRIVIALENENRLFGLACIFLKHGIEESELELVSSETYINHPEGIDWMVTDSMIGRKIPDSVKGTVFVIGEETGVLNQLALDPQLSLEEMYQKMDEYLRRLKSGIHPRKSFAVEESSPSGPRLYLSFSPEGKSGKTSGSLCLCRHLTLQNKKVLYVNFEYPQDFGFFLDSRVKMTEEDAEYMINSPEANVDKAIIAHQNFDYIKPYCGIWSGSVDLKRAYMAWIRQFMEQKIYDVIVAEIPRDPGVEVQELKQMADKVIVFSRQDELSAYKLHCFLESRDLDADKYLYICNLFEENKKNYLEDVDITEYIGLLPETAISSLCDAGAFCMTAEILR